MYGLSNTATAVIRVTDINDNPPEFTAEMVRSNLMYDMSTQRSSFSNITARTSIYPREDMCTHLSVLLTYLVLLALHF